jgi:porphobilinogen synthase
MSLSTLVSAPTRFRRSRLRRQERLRDLVAETRLDPSMLVLPVFVDANVNAPFEIASLPGHSRLPAREVPRIAEKAIAAGIGGLLLFGLPAEKDDRGEAAADPLGPVPMALRAVRDAAPNLALIADVCLCEYTTHGHCGVIARDGAIDNDATLPLLAAAARTYAEAGADVVAPSDMMDGRVAAIRQELDRADLGETAILAYSAKYASSFYGPFRDAADCAPRVGDRAGYQMDPRNGREALAEIAADLEEGADMFMVKPAGPYLDVIAAARGRFEAPLAAYQVSGEYAALHAAAARGWIDLRRAAVESLTGIARAGADVIVTYFALDAAAWIRER